MVIVEPLKRMLSDLTWSCSFEDAATVTLREALAVSCEAMTASSFTEQGVILRGMVHLRARDGYRALRITEHTSESSPYELEAAFLPSATLWRYIVAHGCPVSLDVQQGAVHFWPSTDAAPSSRMVASPESLARRLSRDATDVYAIPLRAPGGTLAGMISVDVRCETATNKALLWETLGEPLLLLVGVAAPYLTTLPVQPAAIPKPDPLLPVVGASTASLIELVQAFARQEETILITGPPGIGKTALARFCHARSRRSKHPFVVLDLSSLTPEQHLGALVGTEGQDAVVGSFAKAQQGTLFINGIDKLSAEGQEALVRALRQRIFRPLGEAADSHTLDVRFVIGAHPDLHTAAQAGRYRRDLYDRINILAVKLPALAERQDELPEWAGYMLSRHHREYSGQGEARLSPEAIDKLLEKPWPGNLRQLDSVIRRAYAAAMAYDTNIGKDIFLELWHIEQALEERGWLPEPPATESIPP